MAQNDRHITDALLLNYIRNQVNDAQRDQVEGWLAESGENRLYLEKIRRLWEHSSAWSSFEKIYTPGDWEKVSQRMGFETGSITMKPARGENLGSMLRIAAIALVFLSIGYLTWNIVANQGLPARQMAVMTGEEPSSFDLPDGSTIHLNVHSSLSYPKKFRKNSRQVELKGEGFFEVEADSRRPFTIISGNASVKVLGTSFNVCHEPGSEKVIVSVSEGKVALFPSRQEKSAIRLTGGEQGICSGQNLIKYDTIDPNTFSWRTGILRFDQSTLPEVFRALQKHYHKTICVQDSIPANPRVTSVFEDQSLDEVLDELNLLLGLEYRQKNDTIFVQIE